MEVMSSSPDAGDKSLATPCTTIVIDALDECEEDEPASAIFSLLARHIDTILSVKSIITGRLEVPIRTRFPLPLLQPHTEFFGPHDVDPSFKNCKKDRSRVDLIVPRPTGKDIAFLVKRCSGLFTVAFIGITRLVGDHNEPQEQLKVVIREADSTTREGRTGIDDIYHHVFLRSLVGVAILGANAFDLLRLVVGSIVLLFNLYLVQTWRRY